MNADPEVRQHLGPLLSAEDAAASVRHFSEDLSRNGFGFWAVEVHASGEFIGFTDWTQWTKGCRSPVSRSAGGWPGPPGDTGMPPRRRFATLDYGFDVIGLPEILAVTSATNLRSQAVMRRIGMTTDPADDFDDPEVDEGPLRRQVLYRKLSPAR